MAAPALKTVARRQTGRVVGVGGVRLSLVALACARAAGDVRRPHATKRVANLQADTALAKAAASRCAPRGRPPDGYEERARWRVA